MSRQQLPPQIKKITLKKRENGKPAVRYQLCVDVGTIDGKRKQHKERFKNLDDALAVLAKLTDQRATGTFVHDEKLTVRKMCDDWIASKHKLKASTIKGHKDKLTIVQKNIGDIEVLKLTKGDIDALINKLRAGTAKGIRRRWSARSVNYMLSVLTAALKDLMKQGRLVRNVAALVDRLPSEQQEMKTLTEEQMYMIFDHECWDQHLWVLGLHGLRRAELAGLRWEDIDFVIGTISITVTRVGVGNEVVVGTPKSEKSRRVLPMPEDVGRALKAAQTRQKAAGVMGEYVSVNEKGKPHLPNTISFRWGRMLDALAIPRVRLHDSRHTCATLMHLRGVPIAVIAAWLGHASAAFTQKTYAHSQDAALVTAAQTFRRDVTKRDNKPAAELVTAA
ncbi:tyrosine recombinase XerC [Nocardia rhizosphaerihabitans]|uniref:site-specific integrase n=1 Tax=Nocardia rhizosphaerihabitans TaxID=1691570 RepID=UPI0036726861